MQLMQNLVTQLTQPGMEISDSVLLSEQEVLTDIRHFEEQLSRLTEASDSHALAMRAVYRNLLNHRRKLLAAWRDGHPEEWYLYPPAET